LVRQTRIPGARVNAIAAMVRRLTIASTRSLTAEQPVDRLARQLRAVRRWPRRRSR
jgi:hypothetical protein